MQHCEGRTDDGETDRHTGGIYYLSWALAGLANTALCKASCADALLSVVTSQTPQEASFFGAHEANVDVAESRDDVLLSFSFFSAHHCTLCHVVVIFL